MLPSMSSIPSPLQTVIFSFSRSAPKIAANIGLSAQNRLTRWALVWLCATGCSV